jgi:hypothetical protein
LLTLPAGPHGAAKNAIYSVHKAGQYGRMAEWVQGLGTNERPGSTPPLLQRESEKNIARDAPDGTPSQPRLLSQEAMKAKPLAAARTNRVKPTQDDGDASEVTPASYQEPPAEFLQSNRPQAAAVLVPDNPAVTTDPRSRMAPAKKIKRGVPLPQAESKDPFDPEVFNRRYHGVNTPAEGGKPAVETIPPIKASDPG